MENFQNWYLENKKKPKAKIRLFCFHHSGGGASAYFPWNTYFSSDIEMICIQLPGREDRYDEPLVNDLSYILHALSTGFRPYQNKPFIFFGHSLGAFLAFESLKAIHKLYSLYPCHVILSSTKAPHLPLRTERLSKLNDLELKEALRAYNGIDETILENNDLLEIFLPIVRNDFSVYENYSYSESPPLPCDILALSGTQDPTVTQEEIMAWSSYTTGKFEHLAFPGGHFFIKLYQNEIIKIINQIARKYM